MPSKLSIGTKLVGGYLVTSLLGAAVCAFGLNTIHSVQASDHRLYVRVAEPLGKLEVVSTAFQRIRSNLRDALLADSRDARGEILARIGEREREVDQVLAGYAQGIFTKEGLQMLEDFRAAWSSYVEQVAHMKRRIELGEIDAAKGELKNSVEIENRVRDRLHVLVDRKVSIGKTDSEANEAQAKSAESTMLLALGALVLLSLGLGLFFSASIARPLRRMARTARQIASGDVDQIVDYVSGDEVGELADAMRETIEYVKDVSKGAEALATGNLEIKLLPKSEKDVLTRNFIRATTSVRSMVEETQRLIQSAKAGRLAARGDAERVEGAYAEIIRGINEMLDSVISPLNVAADYLERLSKGAIPPQIVDEYRGDFNAIRNNLNTCIQAINALVADARMLAASVVSGDLKKRADVSTHEGDFRLIIEGVNASLDAMEGPLTSSIEHLENLARGVVDDQITREYQGDFVRLRESFNGCFKAVNALIVDANMLSAAAIEGKLATRADASKHQGDFRRIVEGVNHTLDAVIGPLNVAAEYVDRISKGAIPEKITKAYSGDFNALKDNLNTCIDAVNALIADANMLSVAAVGGRLSTRADATQHHGDFRRIIEGVNQTLDAVIGPLNVAADYVDKISKGAIPKKITDDYNGDFNTIKNNLNTCIDAVNALVADANMLSAAAVEGKLSTRADASRHGGDFRKIVDGVNATLDAVIKPLEATAGYIEMISRGEIPERIAARYVGDFNAIGNSLNSCVEAVNSLVADANMLSAAAVEGKLSTRADASRHQGEFRRVVEGVNETLDAVMGPIEAATGVLQKLSEQDLRARVTGEYRGDHAKIKRAVNSTATALHDALQSVAEAVDKVASASDQIATTSQSVSQGASEQAAALEETSSNLEELSSMTKQNADNTAQANVLAQGTKTAAGKGSVAMERMSEAMREIRQGAEGTAEIIRDINEIAFQTNLLALNAAVEAARAGDAGRGFAVVADEVRTLAMRAKEAARKTEDLIKESVKLAGDGEALSREVAGGLGEIVTSVGKVTGIVGEIAAASQEQSSGIDQINKAVVQMDKVTQQAAGNAEEASSAAEELAGQATTLASLVSRFKLERKDAVAGGRREKGAQAASARGRFEVQGVSRRAESDR